MQGRTEKHISQTQALLQLYRSAFEQSRDAVVFFDGDCFIDANPAALALFGVPDLATFTTLHPADLSPPRQADGDESPALIEQHIATARDQGHVFVQWECQRLDRDDSFPAEVLISRVDVEPDTFVLQAMIRDISERVTAHRELEQREAVLIESQRIAKVGNWLSDFRNNRIEWSDEVYRIFGMDREQWGATHESFMAAVHPEDREHVQQALEQSLKSGPYDITHRIRRPDGTLRVVRERGETQYDANTTPIGMLGTVQDITEQWEMQRSLERLVAILDATPDIVTMHDAQGTMLYMNAAGRRFNHFEQLPNNTPWIPGQGWQRDGLPQDTESMETTLERFHPPDALAMTRNIALPEAIANGFWQGENEIYDPDGNIIPVSQVILVHRNEAGEIEQSSTMIRDISERKQMENALRQREQRYRLSQQAAHFGVWDWDLARDEIIWDSGCWLLLGYRQDHDQRLNIHDWEQMVHPDDLARVQPQLKQMLADEGRFVVEFRYRCADDRWLWVQGRGQVTEYSNQGQPLKLIGTHTDIHELKTTQEQSRARANEMRLLSDIIQTSVDDELDTDAMLETCVRQINRHWPQAAVRIETDQQRYTSRPFFETERRYRAQSADHKSQVVVTVFCANLTCQFSSEERQLLEAIAQQLKNALQRRRAQADLEYAARIDRLTQLSNRQDFDQHLEHTLALYHRYNMSAALVMFDIDHFKLINDRYGHALGDEVLVELAERLRNALRDTDIPARWGGEEFMVIMPDTDLSGARISAERLRQRMASRPFEGVGQVTISVGVARIEPHDDSDSLLKRVDDALYEAKHGGRNRVVCQKLDLY